MTPEILSEAIGLLDDDIIEAADKARELPVKKRSMTPVWLGLGSMAACAAIVASVALSGGNDSVPTLDNGNTSGSSTATSQTETDTAGATKGDSSESLDEISPDSCECTVDDVLVDAVESTDYVVTMEVDDANPGMAWETEELLTGESPILTGEAVEETGDVAEDTLEIVEIEDTVDITGEVVDETGDVVVETGDVAEETGEYVDDTMECIETAEISDITTETGENNENPSTGGDFEPVKGYFDSDFVSIDGNPSTGAPVDYEELMQMLASPNSFGLDSYYLFYVQRVLTLGECEQLDGFAEAYRSYYPAYSEETTEVGAVDSDSYPSDFIIYEVEMVQDLITGDYIGQIMYIMSTGNCVAYQEYGDPPYSPHELFAAALMKPIEGTDIRRTTGSFALRYDVRDDMAYSRGNDTMDALMLPGSETYKETLITSTTKNPARYTQMLPLESLCDFLRDDWKERGVSRHFSN